jgi:hypothetical protein
VNLQSYVTPSRPTHKRSRFSSPPRTNPNRECLVTNVFAKEYQPVRINATVTCLANLPLEHMMCKRWFIRL